MLNNIYLPTPPILYQIFRHGLLLLSLYKMICPEAKYLATKLFANTMAPLKVCSRFMLFLCPLLLLVTIQVIAQPDFQSVKCFNEKGNYTTSSTYQTNRNTLLSSLSSPFNNGNDYNFYNLSYGQNSNQVHAIALCRGNVEADVCHSCLKNSTQKITEVCPNQKEVFGYYDECMLCY